MNKKVIIWSIISLSILLIFFWLWNNVFVLAYGSVLGVCDQEKFNEKYPEYILGGLVNTSINQTTGELESVIYLFINDSTILKHEQCHVSQFNRPIQLSIDCDTKTGRVGRFIIESECYLTQRLPDFIHNFLY